MRYCGVITRFNPTAALLFVALLAGGCAPAVIIPPVEDAAASRQAFHLSASALVRPDKGAAQRFQIRWRRTVGEDGTHDNVRIQDIFGVTRAKLTQTPRLATARLEGKTLIDDAATDLAEKLFGYALPINAFGYWALGVAAPDAPAETVRNLAGEIVEISQLGWRVSYLRRDGGGKPQKISLTAPTAKIEINIKEWLIP